MCKKKIGEKLYAVALIVVGIVIFNHANGNEAIFALGWIITGGGIGGLIIE